MRDTTEWSCFVPLGQWSPRLKRVLIIVSVFVLGLTYVFAVVGYGKDGVDFPARYWEVRCVRDGVNPFDVWSGKIEHDRYYPSHVVWNGNTKGKHGVVAYPPWEYTLLLPLSFLDFNVAVLLWNVINEIGLLALFIIVFRIGRSRTRDVLGGLVCSAAFFSIGRSVSNCFRTGNWTILTSLSFACMLWALSKRKDLLAGVFLAVCLVKPQFGLLLIIPLVLRRKFFTVTMACALLLVASIPPALLCRTSPVELVMQIATYGSYYIHQTAFIPWPVADYLNRMTGLSVSFMSSLLGIVVCVGASLFTRNEKDWLWAFCSAIVCALAWSIFWDQDRIYWGFVNLALATWLLGRGGGYTSDCRLNPTTGKCLVVFIFLGNAFFLSRYFLLNLGSLTWLVFKSYAVLFSRAAAQFVYWLQTFLTLSFMFYVLPARMKNSAK